MLHNNLFLGGHFIIPNSLSVFQFKEKYQKLEQQRTEIDKNITDLLFNEMSKATTTIIELKKINFIFTHPDDNTLRTKHGAIVGVDSQYLYVYCANGNPVVHLVNKRTDTIPANDNSIPFLDNFVHFCNVAFAFNGLESLEEQMRNCLTSLEEQIKQRRQVLDSRFNSNS